MYIVANSIKEVTKKVSLYRSLYNCTGSLAVYITGEVKIDGKKQYLHDQRITVDFKTIDFHQYNGLKKPFKFVESVYLTIRQLD